MKSSKFKVQSSKETLFALAKASAGPEMYFEQNDPHPDPLPSDGRGNSQTRFSQVLQRLDTLADGGRFSLSHRMGEGRGEGFGASTTQTP